MYLYCRTNIFAVIKLSWFSQSGCIREKNIITSHYTRVKRVVLWPTAGHLHCTCSGCEPMKPFVGSCMQTPQAEWLLGFKGLLGGIYSAWDACGLCTVGVKQWRNGRCVLSLR